MQSGRHAARTIVRRLRGRQPKPFRYLDLGTMATIARFRAVATVGRLELSGFAGWVLWLAVHLAFLVGFKNRLATVASWLSPLSAAAGASAPSPSSRCLRTQGLGARNAAR